MKYNIHTIISVLFLSVGMASCADSADEPQIKPSNSKLEMAFTFSHPAQSRATETAFEKNDVVGLFVSEADKVLEIAGNTLTNEALTFNGASWTSKRKLYWDDGKFNVYAYYPYRGEVTSITDLPFNLSLDQQSETSSGMTGYEASDFLFASGKGVTASASPVNLQFRHIMSKLTVRLIKGEDFEGDFSENATVYIHNTITDANIDLIAGVATKDTHGKSHSVIARRNGVGSYSAIIVPQRLDNRVPLIEIVMNGVSFMYESKFQFKPGVHHLVNLVVDKNPEQVKIEVGGEIIGWD